MTATLIIPVSTSLLLAANVDISYIDYAVRTSISDFIACSMMNSDKHQKQNLALKMFRYFYLKARKNTEHEHDRFCSLFVSLVCPVVYFAI